MIRGTEVDFALAIAKHEGMVAVHADGIGVTAFIANARGNTSLEMMSFDVTPDRAEQIVRKYDSRHVDFVELPPFNVTTETTGDRVFDIAPALYALWHANCNEIFSYLSVYIHDDDISLATVAVDAFLYAESDGENDVEAEHGHAEFTAYEEWIRQLSASANRDVQDFGLGLGNVLAHFENRDPEGNELDENGEPIDIDEGPWGSARFD